MDGLAGEGFILLGGPIGEGDGDNALMIVDAESESAVRARLADDPWGEDNAHVRERAALVGLAPRRPPRPSGESSSELGVGESAKRRHAGNERVQRARGGDEPLEREPGVRAAG
jgi:hypothetical protein